MPFPKNIFGKAAFISHLIFPLAGLLILFLDVTTKAGDNYQFDHWTTSEGLPNNTINAILQTRDGYLWIATNDGLARFDGVRFTRFHRSNTVGFESNRLSSLFEDKNGTLWIASQEGVLISYRAGRFTSFTDRDDLQSDDFASIDQDDAGHLWITGRRKIVIEYYDGHFITHRPADYLPGAIASSSMHDHLWWSQDEKGVYLFYRGRVLTLTRKDGLPSLEIRSVTIDQSNAIWINTKGGIVRLKDSRLKIFSLNKYYLGGQAFGAFFEDRRGALWHFTEDYLRSLRNGELTVHFKIHDPGANFYEDREGSVWIGMSDGLHRIRGLTIHMLTEARDRRYTLTLSVYSVLQDREGDVWLGKWGAGVSRYHSGRFTHFLSGEAWLKTITSKAGFRDNRYDNIVYDEGLFSSKITSLYEDRSGVIWVGTDRGVSRMQNGRLERFSDQHGLNQCYAVLQDRAGDFWFATEIGLTRLHEGIFTVYTIKDGLPANECHALLEDRRGALWIGFYGGLARFDHGRFTSWTEADGLAGKQIRNLYEDSSGSLWICTHDAGLTRYKDGRFTRYTSKEGLVNYGVSHLLDDGIGSFWLSSNRGIIRVRQAELNALAEGRLAVVTSVAYGVKDGMLNAECNGGRQPSGWKLRNGELWFPTAEGVAIIDPARLPINPLPPPVVIEECRLDQNVIALQHPLVIEPGHNSLELQYTGNSLIQSEFVKFKYKLEGFDKDWVNAGVSRTAKYSNLPPGPYTFTVLAANSDDVWSERGPTLRIIVTPPFWRRWWFSALAGLVAVGAISLIVRRRFVRLKAEALHRQEFARQLIDSQERERKRIASELHDSLSQDLILIRNWAQQGMIKLDEKSQGRRQLEDISERSAQALGGVKEIINNLHPHLIEEVGLSGALKMLFRKATSSSGISFTSEIDLQADELSPRNRITLFRIIQECVNNIIKHSHATEARLAITLTGRQLSLQMQDNGCGFDAASYEIKGRPGSLGLTSLTERAHMIGGECLIQSTPGRGTLVTVTLKLEESERGE